MSSKEEVKDAFDPKKDHFAQNFEKFAEKKFDEFLGDSEDSTEISLIVSNLSLNSDSNYTNQENDLENFEIFNIMMNRNKNNSNNFLILLFHDFWVK